MDRTQKQHKEKTETNYYLRSMFERYCMHGDRINSYQQHCMCSLDLGGGRGVELGMISSLL